MDEELQELAALVLRNAFWRDFSALVNKYLQAAEGLDIEAQEQMMGNMTSIYGRDTKADTTDVSFNLWTRQGKSPLATTSHDTMLEALEMPGATDVYFQGRKVFDRRDTGWYYVEGGT